MPAFDVVCRVDLQEVDNAIQQTLREIGQRFDFKGQRTELRREETALHLLAADDYKLRALPNEDVYFYFKKIDNARVVREADPTARARS